MKDLQKIAHRLLPAVTFAKRYIKFIFFIFIATLCAFLLFQVNSYGSVEPSEDQVTEKLTSVSRPHIDESSLKKIQELEEQNVEVKSLFQQARDNPFSE